MNRNSLVPRPVILLDEPLLGLDVFLRDLGWEVVKVKQGISDDDVLRIAAEKGYVLVTPDAELAGRCRLKGVSVAEVRKEEHARLVDQILQRDFEKAT